MTTCSIPNTSFARRTPEEFLAHANASLAESHERWSKAGLVILTLGTAWCFRHRESGKVVANCLKRPDREFSRERLSFQAATTGFGTLQAQAQLEIFLVANEDVGRRSDPVKYCPVLILMAFPE